ncbi:type I restriction enzyme S subunit [Paenibacillus sp. RC73]|uniref:restriction endonuclease subunit S n=1 Tax=Paenibacillus sp. RC73 TaxID=3156250 RepID=UPI0038384C7C
MAKYRFEEIAYNSTEKKKPVEEDRFSYIGLEHLDPGSLKVTRYGSDVAPTGEKLVMKEGDVLFGKRRAYQKKVAISPFAGIFSAHGMVLRPREDVIDKDFFPLFISSDYFLDAAIKISVGSLSPTINWRDLKILEFELPHLAEQRKLAKVLWAVNVTLESYRKLITATEQLVKSQFIEMFVGSSENVLLSDYVWFQEGPGVRSVDFAASGTILLTGSNINDNQISFGYNSDRFISTELSLGKYQHFICNENDILAVTSAIEPAKFDKKVVVVQEDNKYCLNTGIIRFKPNREFLTLCYFREFLKSDFFKSQVMTNMHGIAQMHFGPSHLKHMKMLLPKNLTVQKRFSEFITQSDKSKFELEQALKELDSTYKKIISENLG